MTRRKHSEDFDGLPFEALAQRLIVDGQKLASLRTSAAGERRYAAIPICLCRFCPPAAAGPARPARGVREPSPLRRFSLAAKRSMFLVSKQEP